MTAPGRPPLVRRTPHVLRPDPGRVINRIFLPGQEVDASGQSRSVAVLQRVRALSDAQVDRALADTLASFGPRHADLPTTLESHFRLIAHRLPEPDRLSPSRRQLVGAYFSQEYALEAAALFNPSIVGHPDQEGLAAGTRRFVMSVRAVGEGHISSIEFRTGTIDAHDDVRVDEPGPCLALPQPVPTTYSRAVFAQQHAQAGGDPSTAQYVLDSLRPYFVRHELDAALARLHGQRLTRADTASTIERFEWIAACNYTVQFAAESALHDRVLLPTAPTESHGLEDARFVGFTEADGGRDYRGTYTAFDGVAVAPQLVRTDDFRTFHICQLSGPAAKNKGMALFPRPVGGRYLALSRWDRESNALAGSDDMSRWDDLVRLQAPERPWEIVQVGNCGPPLETEAGWVVLTHGVGPMRRYSIGAMLLDRDDPTVVLGRLPQPLLSPRADERDGYVPNVVYSCGAMAHGDTLVLPYGCSDAAVRIALVDLPRLVAALQNAGPGADAAKAV